MSKKSLLETNPYLKNPETRNQIISVVTVSSSAVEGVHVAAKEGLKNAIRVSVNLVEPSSSSSKSRS